MDIKRGEQWKDKLTSPNHVIEQITPGMTIFISTGVSEPLTLMKSLKQSKDTNLDLDIFQLVSLGEAISL
jgi:acyl-CoA hydrolase